MAAVSIQLMPESRASRMAAIESLSSWPPHANSQPEPPIAHAPKPIGVMYKSEVPSCVVFMSAVSVIFVALPGRACQEDEVSSTCLHSLQSRLCAKARLRRKHRHLPRLFAPIFESAGPGCDW